MTTLHTPITAILRGDGTLKIARLGDRHLTNQELILHNGGLKIKDATLDHVRSTILKVVAAVRQNDVDVIKSSYRGYDIHVTGTLEHQPRTWQPEDPNIMRYFDLAQGYTASGNEDLHGTQMETMFPNLTRQRRTNNRTPKYDFLNSSSSWGPWCRQLKDNGQHVPITTETVVEVPIAASEVYLLPHTRQFVISGGTYTAENPSHYDNRHTRELAEIRSLLDG